MSWWRARRRSGRLISRQCSRRTASVARSCLAMTSYSPSTAAACFCSTRATKSSSGSTSTTSSTSRPTTGACDVQGWRHSFKSRGTNITAREAGRKLGGGLYPPHMPFWGYNSYKERHTKSQSDSVATISYDDMLK